MKTGTNKNKIYKSKNIISVFNTFFLSNGSARKWPKRYQEDQQLAV